MKLENNPTFETQSPPRKSYNPFDSDDEHTDDFIKSYADTYNSKGFEKNTDPLALNLDNDKMSWEEAMLHHSSESVLVMNGVEVLPSKDGELFTDKTVINGAKESFHYTVKDIGVDEGLPEHNKGSNVEKDLMKGQNSANPFETDYLTKTDELKHDNESCEGDEVNYDEVDIKGNEDAKKERSVVNDAHLENVKESSRKPSIMNTTEAVVKSKSETKDEEATTLKSSQHSLQQTSTTTGDDATDALTYNRDMASQNIVMNSNPGKEEEEKGDLQTDVNVKRPKPQTISRHDEDGAIDMDRCVHGGTGFSSTVPPHALSSVTSMARCGSTSLRSESSTGSTRSFAFPVLQTEWNSSPVRMAKPDPRHRQKHRGWVQSLICCKF